MWGALVLTPEAGNSCVSQCHFRIFFYEANTHFALKFLSFIIITIVPFNQINCLYLVLVFQIFFCLKTMETEEENSLSNHLLDHDYVRPVVYEDNPNKEFSEEDKEVFDVDDNREEIIVENDFNQVPETYRMIPGVRHGSKVYVDNLGFRYYMHEASTKSIYLVYERQKNRGFEHCPCRALVSTDLVNNKIYIKDRYQHNHEPAVTNLDVPFFRGAISTRALDWENMYVSVKTVTQ